MTEKKLPNGMKLVFAPGCFDNFEGTQEELDALVKEIEEGVADGSFLADSVSVDMDTIDDLTEEEFSELSDAIDAMEQLFNEKRTLQ